MQDIKLNYSTVIREDYTNKKKIEEEIERRREFERNLRDSTEFEMWQRRCREEDEALRQKEIQDRIEEVSIVSGISNTVSLVHLKCLFHENNQSITQSLRAYVRPCIAINFVHLWRRLQKLHERPRRRTP